MVRQCLYRRWGARYELEYAVNADLEPEAGGARAPRPRWPALTRRQYLWIDPHPHVMSGVAKRRTRLRCRR